jgi:ADP-heptose:LPS heptosyltransferase
VSFSRILIVRACAVGDFVLNLPALRALALQHPDCRFTLVGYPEKLALAEIFLPIEAIHSIETSPWSDLFVGPWTHSTPLRFDAAYVWMKADAFAQNLRRSSVPRVFQAPAFSDSVHAADHLLRSLGLSAPELPDLWEPASEKVIVHPGSGAAAKCWPHFAGLIEYVRDAVVLIGPADADIATSRPCLRGLSLLEVAEELRQCRCFIGNDSGITHLAAYMGCPTVALFGPTDPRAWGPVGRRVEVLWKTRLADISVDEVSRLL